MFDTFTCHLPNDLLEDLQEAEMDALEALGDWDGELDL